LVGELAVGDDRKMCLVAAARDLDVDAEHSH
jgi:hypothetical protein